MSQVIDRLSDDPDYEFVLRLNKPENAVKVCTALHRIVNDDQNTPAIRREARYLLRLGKDIMTEAQKQALKNAISS